MQLSIGLSARGRFFLDELEYIFFSKKIWIRNILHPNRIFVIKGGKKGEWKRLTINPKQWGIPHFQNHLSSFKFQKVKLSFFISKLWLLRYLRLRLWAGQEYKNIGCWSTHSRDRLKVGQKYQICMKKSSKKHLLKWRFTSSAQFEKLKKYILAKKWSAFQLHKLLHRNSPIF